MADPVSELRGQLLRAGGTMIKHSQHGEIWKIGNGRYSLPMHINVHSMVVVHRRAVTEFIKRHSTRIARKKAGGMSPSEVDKWEPIVGELPPEPEPENENDKENRGVPERQM